jgi:hypothetical protein
MLKRYNFPWFGGVNDGKNRPRKAGFFRRREMKKQRIMELIQSLSMPDS